MKLKLYSLTIKGLRKHLDTTVLFGDSTFLIGKNNVGKSTVFRALELLLNDVKKIDSEDEFLSVLNETKTENVNLTNEIVIMGEFRDCPEESTSWKGLKGRVFSYDTADCPEETGLRIFYRKTYEKGQNVKIEMRQQKRVIKECFQDCKSINDYIENGFPEDVIKDLFEGVATNRNLTQTQLKKLLLEEDLYDLLEEEEWFENPGGIPGVVLSRLPNFLLIPAQDKMEELSGNSGALIKTMGKLFEDVRNSSPNYIKAQEYLNKLQEELDPSDDSKEFGKMMRDLNDIVGDVFPNTRLLASANLSDADKSIRPIFDVRMSNNVNTPIENQGTGVIRSAVFAMLRYRTMREANGQVTPLIIGFEEPEIYLHPSAAHQLRDTIYELASSSTNQIICTTHSPFMIDLSRKSNQVLNHFCYEAVNIEKGTSNYLVDKIISNPFNVTKAFRELHENDKSYVKMLLKMDDYMSKVFFVENVLIVEGDTEDIVIRESIQRMPDSVRKDILHNWHIVKARGKASIISLVKYFLAMGIRPYVIHDKDSGTAGAEIFNGPIASVTGEERRIMLENCIEDVLGYAAPTSEKPYRAHRYINSNWGKSWDEVEGDWKTIMESLFEEAFQSESDGVGKVEIRKATVIAKKVKAAETVSVD